MTELECAQEIETMCADDVILENGVRFMDPCHFRFAMEEADPGSDKYYVDEQGNVVYDYRRKTRIAYRNLGSVNVALATLLAERKLPRTPEAIADLYSHFECDARYDVDTVLSLLP